MLFASSKFKILKNMVKPSEFMKRLRLFVERSKSDAAVCKIDIDDERQWPGSNPPIFLDQAGDFMLPQAEADTRQFVLESDQRFILGCPGTAFPDSSVMKEGRCVAGTFEVEGEDLDELGDLECDRQPRYTTEVVGNRNTKISLPP